MKSVILTVLVLAVLICSTSTALAISSDLKESYLPGETIITEISGNILEPITSSSIEFRRGHILVPLDYGLERLGDRYFLWAIAPENPINYTLIVKDITTFVSGNMKEINYEKNFSVSGNLTDYVVKPGAIVTDKDFEIKVQLNEDKSKFIDIMFTEKTNFSLKPGENIIKVSIADINKTELLNFSVGKYVIPVYVITNRTIITSINLSNLTQSYNITNLTSTVPEEIKEEIDKERVKYHCYEFPGKICAVGEKCTGEIIQSMEGNSCCVNGVCETESSGGGSAWIGYLLGAVVVIVGVVIWMKYKKVKVEGNPLEKKVHSLERKGP
jgi:hypothetical protein